MKKIIIPMLFLLIFSSGFAIFNLFEKPLTPVNQITLHSINESFYGVNSTDNPNVTCEPIHFQMPYKQTQDKTYIKLGYFPICDVNQSSYQEHLTLYCQGEYVATYNVTDNCISFGGGGTYEYEWLEINVNTTDAQFQSEGLSSTYSCYFCVNITSNIPRADFWIRTENTGTKITIQEENVTVIVGTQEITQAMLSVVEITLLILSIISTSITIFGMIWAIFAFPLFLIFILRMVYANLRKLIKSSSRGR